MKEIRTDILIIGSGLAGMAAAYEAKAAGADVIVVEKMKYFGGNSALAGGGFSSWDSRLHLREKNGFGEDSAEQLAADTIRSGKGHCVDEMVQLMAQKAPEAIDWILDRGVPFKDTVMKMGGFTAYHAYHTAVTGAVMMKTVRESVLDTGVLLLNECEVTELLFENGKADGALCRLQGEEVRFIAEKGVILASGGFAGDVPFRQRFNSEITGDYNCSNHKGATGEVLQMAMEMGANVLNMQYVQLFPSADPVSGAVDKWALVSYDAPGFGGIYVTAEGKRFVNELEGRDVVSDAQLKNAKERTWVILCKALTDRMGHTEAALEKGIQNRRIFKAETLKELEETVGINAENLAETIEGHNRYIAGTCEDPFGKTWDGNFIPITEGPYYAIAQWPSVHFTMGGLETDRRARVIDRNGNVIPGLYAAGEICGCLHGANRLAGNALTECVVFGRIAGQEASGNC